MILDIGPICLNLPWENTTSNILLKLGYGSMLARPTFKNVSRARALPYLVAQAQVGEVL